MNIQWSSGLPGLFLNARPDGRGHRAAAWRTGDLDFRRVRGVCAGVEEAGGDAGVCGGARGENEAGDAAADGDANEPGGPGRGRGED